MKKNRAFSLFIFFVMVAVITGFSTSCSKKSQKPAPKQSETAKKEIPEALKKIESSIDDIIKEFEKKEEGQQTNQANDASEEKDRKQQSQDKESGDTKQKPEQESSDQQSKGKESSDQQSKGKESSDQQSKDNESDEEKKWKNISQKVEGMHKQWNALQPEVVQEGASKALIDNFSNSLNQVTIYEKTKDEQNIKMATSELYRFIADFTQFYTTDVPPDIKRIKYYIENIKYNAAIEKWDVAKTSVEQLKSYWSILKIQLKKEQQKLGSQMEFAIYELEKVVNEANAMLTKIKSDIALQGIDQIEESFKKNK